VRRNRGRQFPPPFPPTIIFEQLVKRGWNFFSPPPPLASVWHYFFQSVLTGTRDRSCRMRFRRSGISFSPGQSSPPFFRTVHPFVAVYRGGVHHTLVFFSPPAGLNKNCSPCLFFFPVFLRRRQKAHYSFLSPPPFPLFFPFFPPPRFTHGPQPSVFSNRQREI